MKASEGDTEDSPPLSQETTPIIFLFSVHRSTSHSDEDVFGFVTIHVSLSSPFEEKTIKKQIIEAIRKSYSEKEWQIKYFSFWFAGTMEEMKRVAKATRNRLFG